MSQKHQYTILCPCCEATLTVDARTGALISHEEKKKPVASFEALTQDLDRQKHARENIFAQELKSQKERERILEEKFQEAFKRADKSATPFRNPLDFD